MNQLVLKETEDKKKPPIESIKKLANSIGCNISKHVNQNNLYLDNLLDDIGEKIDTDLIEAIKNNLS